MKFTLVNSRLILETIVPSTPCARIPRWHSQLKRAWLIKVGDRIVHSVDDVKVVFEHMVSALTVDATNNFLTFLHAEIKHGLTNDGIR